MFHRNRPPKCLNFNIAFPNSQSSQMISCFGCLQVSDVCTPPIVVVTSSVKSYFFIIVTYRKRLSLFSQHIVNSYIHISFLTYQSWLYCLRLRENDGDIHDWSCSGDVLYFLVQCSAKLFSLQFKRDIEVVLGTLSEVCIALFHHDWPRKAAPSHVL